jgi:hypothetical protein
MNALLSIYRQYGTYGWLIVTTIARHARCTANWQKRDVNNGTVKMRAGGRCLLRRGRGFEREMKKKKAAMNRPITVACWSPCFTPWRYLKLGLYYIWK